MSADLSSIFKIFSGASKALGKDSLVSFVNAINSIAGERDRKERREKAESKLAELEKKLGELESFSPENAREVFSLAEELASKRKPKLQERLSNALYGISSSLLGKPVPPVRDTSFEDSLGAILNLENNRRALAGPYASLYSTLTNAQTAREAADIQERQYERESAARSQEADRRAEHEKSVENRLRTQFEESNKLAKEKFRFDALRTLFDLYGMLTGNTQQGGLPNFADALRGQPYKNVEGGLISFGGENGLSDFRQAFIREIARLLGLPLNPQQQIGQVPQLPLPLPRQPNSSNPFYIPIPPDNIRENRPPNITIPLFQGY